MTWILKDTKIILHQKLGLKIDANYARTKPLRGIILKNVWFYNYEHVIIYSLVWDIVKVRGSSPVLFPLSDWKEETSWNFTTTEMGAYVGRGICKEHTIPVFRIFAPFLSFLRFTQFSSSFYHSLQIVEIIKTQVYHDWTGKLFWWLTCNDDKTLI